MRPRNASASRPAPTVSTTSNSKDRIGANRACIALARKLLKRSYHILSELGDQALQPVAA